MKMRINKLSKSGFTLPELIVATGIGTIIMAAIMMVMVGVQRSTLVGGALVEVNSDVRLAMDRIVRDARWATQLETIKSIGGTNYATATDELVVAIPSIDGSGDIIPGTVDYVAYYLDPSDMTIMRKAIDADGLSSRADADTQVAKNINNFQLSFNGVDLSSVANVSNVTQIEISLMGNKSIQGGDVGETISSIVELRNY